MTTAPRCPHCGVLVIGDHVATCRHAPPPAPPITIGIYRTPVRSAVPVHLIQT